MTHIANHTRGRLIIGGLFLLLLLALPLGATSAEDETPTPTIEGLDENDESSDVRGIRMAKQRIAKLKEADPLDLEALQSEYLILHENFPRYEEGKTALFDLYHLLRRHDRTQQAYAVLMKVTANYQDNETMVNPDDAQRPIVIVATANIELADLFAAKMDNPYTAMEILQRTLLRFPEAVVGTEAEDRQYLGPIGVIAHLHLADLHMQLTQPNRASAELLTVVRDFPGQKVTLDSITSGAAAAAVRRLPALLKTMPASVPKKMGVLTTFEQTAVEEEPRVWILFYRADLQFEAFTQWRNAGAFAQGVETYKQIIEQHPNVMLATPEGEEPAGVRAIRLSRDATVLKLKNLDRAILDLSAFQVKFAKRKKTRTLAAYAMLYLAELELDFRQNAPSAFKLFSQVADEYGDIPDYPRKEGENKKLKERAERWAERAQQRM